MSDAAPKAPAAPKASRLTLPRWLDPKLLLGVLLVLIAMLLGVRVFASMDDSVQVWALKDNMVVGAPVSPNDVVAVSIRFFSNDQAKQYVSAAKPFPGGKVATQDMRKHQLVPVASLAGQATKQLLDFPVPVKPENLPPLKPQDRVNIVVVTDSTSSGTSPTYTMVLSEAEVVSAPSDGGGALSVGTSAGGLTVRVDPSTQKGFNETKVAGLLQTGNLIVINRHG